MNRIFITLLFLCPSVSFPAPVDYSVQLNEVRYVDLMRVVFGDILNRSYVLDKDVVNSVDMLSVNWSKLSQERIEALMLEVSKMRGFRFRDVENVLVVDLQRPEEQTIVLYRPKYRSAHYLSELVQNLTGASLHVRNAVQNQFKPDLHQPGVPPPQSPQQSQPQAQAQPIQAHRSGASVDNDQLALLVDPQEQKKVLKLLADLDTPPGEVMLRAAVYEVGSTQAEGGAIKVAAGILRNKLQASIGTIISHGVSVSFNSASLDVVLSALDNDTRFKILSRPQVRVQSGSQAKFSVGQDVPTLGAAQIDKSGNFVQSIVYQQSGIILTTTPEIRDNVIDLTIGQEMSSFSETTTGVNNSPTLYKRSVNSKLSIQPGEVVVFAGLQETHEDNNTSKVPFFGWTLSHEKKRTESEILVFVEAVRI